MAINWTNENEVLQAKQKLSAAGVDSERIESFVAKKRKQSQLTSLVSAGRLTADKAIELGGIGIIGSLPTTEKQSAATQKRELILNQAAPVLERIVTSAVKAPTGMKGAFLAKIGKIPGIAGGEAEYLSRDTEGFARLIASAFASEVGVATNQDVDRWKKIMPQPGDTMGERIRQSQFLINQIKAEAESLGIKIPTSIIKAAKQLPGFKETESLAPIQQEQGVGPIGTLGKKKIDNSTIDNKLINWLANSEFLPFAGSLIGGVAGFAGGPAGSVALGATGAVTGKTAQLALRELIDPDRQDISTASKLIINEAITDAVWSGIGLGAGFAVGKGLKGLKLVLGAKPAEEGLEQLAKTTTKRQLAFKKAFAITGKDLENYRDAFKRNLLPDVETMLGKTGYSVNMNENIRLFVNARKSTEAKLNNLLNKNVVDTDEIIDSLKSFKETLYRGGKVRPGLKTTIAEINNGIKSVKGLVKEYGEKSIPAVELDRMIQDYKHFFKGEAIPGTAKAAGRQLRGTLNTILKDISPKMSEAKREWFLTNFMGRHAWKVSDSAKLHPLIKWYEATPFVFGGELGRIGARAVLLKRAMEAWHSRPLVQNKIIDFVLGTAKRTGNKAFFREVLDTLQKIGVDISISPDLLKRAPRQLIEAGMGVGLNEELPPTTQGLPNQPGGGGIGPIENYKLLLYK
jgi:hypothetical protein